MKDAEIILKMIETVDPKDISAIQEIEARVFCWVIREKPPISYAELSKQISFVGGVPEYCTSRDALKAVRPQGWWFTIEPTGWHEDWWKVSAVTQKYGSHVVLENEAHIQTEELAELHAIIQAIAHERAEVGAA